MKNQFSKLIKDLNREATELKTVKRLSTVTLPTATKSITAWGTMKRDNYSQAPVICGKAAYIEITTSEPAPFMVTLSSEEHRNYRIFAFNQGIIVAPRYTRDLDVNMNLGETKTINFTVNITTTDSVTLTATQVDLNY